MTRPFAAAALALATLSACGPEGAGDPQLLVPEDVDVGWDVSYNRADDGFAVLLPADVMVYDGTTGEPLDGAGLDLVGRNAGVMLVDPEMVEIAGEEALWWDAWRDQYFELDAYPERSLHMQTDATGLARVYVFVDWFPGEPSSYGAAVVSVSMGESEASFAVVPR